MSLGGDEILTICCKQTIADATGARLKTCIEWAKDLVPRGFGLEILLGTALCAGE